MSAPSSISSATSRSASCGIRRIHLIRAPVAELRRAFRRFAKRPVKGRGEFGRITHDPGLVETICVQRLANRADASVHHVARSHQIRAGGGVREGGLHEQLHALVVQHMEVIAIHARDAAMAMAHVFAQANIRDHDQLRAVAL